MFLFEKERMKILEKNNLEDINSKGFYMTERNINFLKIMIYRLLLTIFFENLNDTNNWVLG
jgi:hypothetical protein